MIKVKNIAKMATMLSLGLVLNLISFQTGIFGRASFVYFFCIITAFYLGPYKGFIIAGLADLIPALLFPQGPILVLLTFNNAMMALIAGLVYEYTPFKIKTKVVISSFLIFAICTCFISPFAQLPIVRYFPTAKRMAGSVGVTNPFFILLIKQALFQPFWVVINAITSYTLYIRLQKYFPAPSVSYFNLKLLKPVKV